MNDIMPSLMRNITIPLDRLHAHPENYQHHTPLQIERLALSLRTFGQVSEIVVHAQADGTYIIVAGHGLVAAARSESFATLTATVFPVETSSEVITAYLIADNELARLADPDQVALAALLDRYREGDIPLEALGYASADLDHLVAELGDTVLERHQASQHVPDFQEVDETIADDLPTTFCEQCGKLCLKPSAKASW